MTSAYQWMVPFLHRCEKQSPGAANELLKEYLVTLAKEDLKFPLKIFQHSKPDVSSNSNFFRVFSFSFSLVCSIRFRYKFL